MIGLTEIKLKADQNPIFNTNLPGYNQPSLSNAGGVGFFVRDNLKSLIRPDFTVLKDDFEALWVEIQNEKGQNMICGVIYRHPNGNLDTFMDYLNSIIDKVHRENKYCCILGDFNLDLLKFESHPDTNNFLDTLGSFFFQPHILQSTRITDHSSTLIDNIFFNSMEHFTISGNLVYNLTDHLPNFLIISEYSSLPNNIKIYKRDYSNLDGSALITDIQSVNWDELFASNSNPSIMFDSFYTKLSEIVDIHVPVKQLSKREMKVKSKPWITRAIRTSIQVKNSHYKNVHLFSFKIQIL